MNQLSILLLIIVFLLLFLCLFFVFQHAVAQKKNRELSSQIKALETRISSTTKIIAPQVENKTIASVVAPTYVKQKTNGLVELRQQQEKLKEEIARLKAAHKDAENKTKLMEQSYQRQVEQLMQNEKELLQALKQLDTEHHQTLQNRPELAELKEVKQKLNETLNHLQSAQEENRHKTEVLQQLQLKQQTLQKRVDEQNRTLKQWQYAADTSHHETVTPELFLRWYHRALNGRNLYQIMKQMRELSDHKLQSYQEQIEVVAEAVLQKQDHPLPSLSPGEIKADRYLAAAYQLVSSRHQNNYQSSPSMAENLVSPQSIA